jgi:3'-5' exoribonuclease
MKEPTVADLAGLENQTFTGFFAAGSKQMRSGRDGGRYFALTLADRTGSIDGRMWEIEEAGAFEAGDVVKVRGQVSRYNEKLQVKVEKIRRAEPGEYELADFVPHTERDIDGMWTELEGWVASFRDPDLKALLEAFLRDEEVARALREAPAARGMHHAWIGGLLEHVLSLMGLCELAARHYPHVNRDLLLTGVVLHDIGKLRELAWGTSFDYTIEGQLLGHITIGIAMIEAKIAALGNFPAAKRMLVEHLVLSHHGKYEFGSPKLPMTPEAILLHYLDDLDAKMQTVRGELNRNEANGRGGELTEWVRSLERPLLDTEAYLGLHAAAELAVREAQAARDEREGATTAGNVQNGTGSEGREEREGETNHALPFED